MSLTFPELVYTGLLHAVFGSEAALADYLPQRVPEVDAAVTWARRLASMGAKPAAPNSRRVSPFTYLYAEQRDQLPASRYLPSEPLSLAPDVIFPREEERVSSTSSLSPIVLQLLQTELAELANWPANTDRLLALLDLLQRAVWGVPGPIAQGDEPDVSLFDFGRVVAALLPCYQPEAEVTGPVATLISGDISGVQDFIYTITARGATSGLRGRSFY